MNRKLRLLVTTDCPNKCPLCCNNGWDFNKLPVVDRWDYDEIMITGGEPMLYPYSIKQLLDTIRRIQKVMGVSSKIYMYTSIGTAAVIVILSYLDGIVYTPHSRKDVDEFLVLNDILLQDKISLEGKSLRLNLFEDIKAMLPKDINLTKWQVKNMEWIKNCPVPAGEDFRRISKLLTQ